MSAQQAMKAEDGKNVLHILIEFALGRPSGGIILTSSHIETDKNGGNMTAHMGSSAILSGSAVIR
jgi:allantoate deiminase